MTRQTCKKYEAESIETLRVAVKAAAAVVEDEKADQSAVTEAQNTLQAALGDIKENQAATKEKQVNDKTKDVQANSSESEKAKTDMANTKVKDQKDAPRTADLTNMGVAMFAMALAAGVLALQKKRRQR